IAGPVGVPKGTAATVNAEVEASTPDDFLLSVRRTGWVCPAREVVGAVPVVAPFPNVSVHVEESPAVRPQASDSNRRAAVEVRLGRAERVSRRERRLRPGAAGVFPLRLCRQAEAAAGARIEPSQELLDRVPRDALNGAVRFAESEVARIA